MDGWMDGRMDGWMDVLCLEDAYKLYNKKFSFCAGSHCKQLLLYHMLYAAVNLTIVTRSHNTPTHVTHSLLPHSPTYGRFTVYVPACSYFFIYVVL